MTRTPMTPTNSTPATGLKVALAIAALATIALVAGCGESSEQAAVDSSETRAASVTQSGGPVLAVPALETAPGMSSGRSTIVSLGDSLPPEVSASVEDAVIHPGDVIEITAQSSDDASQLSLSDGAGRAQLFTRDPASSTWHVLYRVPMGGSKERFGLSVTALNDVNRWRRVWVFIRIEPSTPAAAVDSLSKS